MEDVGWFLVVSKDLGWVAWGDWFGSDRFFIFLGLFVVFGGEFVGRDRAAFFFKVLF